MEVSPARISQKPYQIVGMTFDPDKDSIFTTRRTSWEESRHNGQMNVWVYHDEVISIPMDSKYLYISGNLEVKSLTEDDSEGRPQITSGTKKHIRDGYFYDDKWPVSLFR